ncbi:hypothetical protein [Sorangium sp. So ce341]|uniref:hypothetical protein n=1 Tax=Sorangium sp. So ce341 TaxID=3133302 RepID=UPI003F622F99
MSSMVAMPPMPASDRWLRWHAADGSVVPTGAERAERERARAERLAAQLRALGVEPDESGS